MNRHEQDIQQLNRDVTKRGWELCLHQYIATDGVQVRGFVVMTKQYEDKKLWHVLHFYNVQTGGFGSGQYFKKYELAKEAFYAKIRLYAPIRTGG
jgi:hypothetical protein